MHRIIHLLLLTIIFQCTLSAQHVDEKTMIEAILAANPQLSESDLSQLRVIEEYRSDQGVQYSYLEQLMDGVPIHHAIGVYAINESNNTIHFSESFIASIAEKKVTADIVKDEVDAITYANRLLGYSELDQLQPSQARSGMPGAKLYTAPSLAGRGATVRLVYYPIDDKLVLAWDVHFIHKDDLKSWNSFIDVTTGMAYSQVDLSSSCLFEAQEEATQSHEHHSHNCTSTHGVQSMTLSGDGATYHVFALPVESPIHGDRTLLVDPADPTYSPYGWHDLDGIEGAETNNTTGNNATVYLDRDADGAPDREVTDDGALVFDYPYDPTLEPDTYADASTVNLFYMVNRFHDILAGHGFDEAAGNFQVTNYTGQGQGNDEVIAYAQYDGGRSEINNANFSPARDGDNGYMRMFLWNSRDDISLFNVVSPASIAGPRQSFTAAFGAEIDENPLTGELVLVDDGVGYTADACQPIMNEAEIAGKIALIDRGICEFGSKILKAERSGAIAAIICNNVPANFGGQMGAGAEGNQVTIPSVLINLEDCKLIKQYLDGGVTITLQKPADDGQPEFVDGTLDNGIVAHEFGHGVSNRLTGGPSVIGCLSNYSIGGRDEGEQMGEGWSDFFAIALTVEPGDQGADPRGIGNYAVRTGVDGKGIRSFPYSTDMSVNPLTYYNIYDESVPHGVGTVWCTMLWDMFWLMVDKYGYDSDMVNGDGGNNRAIRLVVEGMKLQVCNPGFIDGRDGILAADRVLYGGENQLLIWTAFARRGLGFYADQGSSSLVGDGREDYSLPPRLVPTIKIEKHMTPNIVKGEQITVRLHLANDTDTSLIAFKVYDDLPDGTTADLSSLPAGGDVSAVVEGQQIVWSIAQLNPGDTLSLICKLNTPPVPSRLIVHDGFESESTLDNWQPYAHQGNNFFEWNGADPISGDYSWEMYDIQNNNDQQLYGLTEYELKANKPVVRFTHMFSTDAGSDGGLFELSQDFFESSVDARDYIFRGGYNNVLRRGGFVAGSRWAWSGEQPQPLTSYIDLSAYRDQKVNFAWHFGSDDNVTSSFWRIDDFEIFDALNYNSQACIEIAGSSSTLCAQAAEWGTIVEPEVVVATDDHHLASRGIGLSPNPARDILLISLMDQSISEIRIFNGIGQMVHQISVDRWGESIQVDISDWSAGQYRIQALAKEATYVETLIVQ